MRMVERARIVLACLVRKGNSASSAASWRVGSYGQQVAKPICPRWDWRFTGSSAQRQTADLRCRLSHPCAGFAGAGSPGRASTMGRPRGSQTVGSHVHAVWRVLRREGIYLQRLRTWCVSTDPEFAAKAAEVVGLYLNPPLNTLVLSVDEKPSIQAPPAT